MTATIILPTFQEAETVGSTIRELLDALSGNRDSVDICVVDDSPSEETVAAVREIDSEIVSVIHRADGSGLGSAVLRGIKATDGDRIIVMDADGQHPPDVVPAILEALRHCDVVVGSRHDGSGTIDSDWGLMRYAMSAGASALAWIAVPKARPVQDPMSGMFGVHRATVASVFDRLQPDGHKILLELLAKAPVQRIGEVPIEFRPRDAGESTTDREEMQRFLRHLSRLAIQSRRPSRPERFSADQLDQL